MPYSWTIFRKLFGFKAFLAGRNGSISSPVTGNNTARHTSTVTVPTATQPHGSDARSWPSKNSLGFFHKRDKHLRQVNSFGDRAPIHDEFNMVNWKNEHEVDGKSDPLSSSSFEDSTSRSFAGRPEAVADVDRLYRLDDEDLEASLSRAHATRNYEP